jgi:hypothetical protein
MVGQDSHDQYHAVSKNIILEEHNRTRAGFNDQPNDTPQISVQTLENTRSPALVPQSGRIAQSSGTEGFYFTKPQSSSFQNTQFGASSSQQSFLPQSQGYSYQQPLFSQSQTHEGSSSAYFSSQSAPPNPPSQETAPNPPPFQFPPAGAEANPFAAFMSNMFQYMASNMNASNSNSTARDPETKMAKALDDLRAKPTQVPAGINDRSEHLHPARFLGGERSVRSSSNGLRPGRNMA